MKRLINFIFTITLLQTICYGGRFFRISPKNTMEVATTIYNNCSTSRAYYARLVLELGTISVILGGIYQYGDKIQKAHDYLDENCPRVASALATYLLCSFFDKFVFTKPLPPTNQRNAHDTFTQLF